MKAATSVGGSGSSRGRFGGGSMSMWTLGNCPVEHLEFRACTTGTRSRSGVRGSRRPSSSGSRTTASSPRTRRGDQASDAANPPPPPTPLSRSSAPGRALVLAQGGSAHVPEVLSCSRSPLVARRRAAPGDSGWPRRGHARAVPTDPSRVETLEPCPDTASASRSSSSSTRSHIPSVSVERGARADSISPPPLKGSASPVRPLRLPSDLDESRCVNEAFS
jgi:hypothetical protein